MKDINTVLISPPDVMKHQLQLRASMLSGAVGISVKHKRKLTDEILKIQSNFKRITGRDCFI